MDESTRRAVARKLSAADQFDPAYTAQNRFWFVDKLLRRFDELGQSDATIESNTIAVRSASKAIVGLNRDFGLKVDGGIARTIRGDRARRVEILYGLVASSPGIELQSNQPLLKFLAARRYRSVLRMIIEVNSGFLFVYSDPRCAGPKYHVQKLAKSRWEPVADENSNPPTFETGDTTKLRAQSPSSPTDVVDAVEAMWTLDPSVNDSCDLNNFDCARALSAVWMDSLLEASNPQKLLNAVASRGPEHLAIRHPKFLEGQHFMWDTTPERLFSSRGVPATDLQVGDHCYIWNHPVYAQLDFAGVWRGEHALVAKLGSRQLRRSAKFTGHGFTEETIAGINKAFLQTLQTFLDRTYVLTKIFLRYLESGEQSIPASQVTKHARQVKFGDASVLVNIYEFDVEYTARDYRRTPTNGNRTPKITERSFVASHIPGGHALLGDPARPTVAIHWPGMNVYRGEPFLQQTKTPQAGSSDFSPLLWQVAYPSLDGKSLRYLTIFKNVRGRVRQARVGPQDMPKEPLALANMTLQGGGTFGPADVHVTVPTDDTGAAYRTFLQKVGAL